MPANDTPPLPGRGSPQTGPEITASIRKAAEAYTGAWYQWYVYDTADDDGEPDEARLAVSRERKVKADTALRALIAAVQREKGPDKEAHKALRERFARELEGLAQNHGPNIAISVLADGIRRNIFGSLDTLFCRAAVQSAAPCPHIVTDGETSHCSLAQSAATPSGAARSEFDDAENPAASLAGADGGEYTLQARTQMCSSDGTGDRE